MRRLAAILMLCAAPAFAAGGASFAVPPVVLVDRGVICEPVSVQGSRDAPDTEAGRIDVIDERHGFDVDSARVPMQRGFAFGWRLTLQNGAPPRVGRIELTHPPMGADAVTRQGWGVSLYAETEALNLFSFDLPHEMVPGRWTFRYVEGDRVLAEQVFDILPPAQAGDVLERCPGPPMMM